MKSLNQSFYLKMCLSVSIDIIQTNNLLKISVWDDSLRKFQSERKYQFENLCRHSREKACSEFLMEKFAHHVEVVHIGLWTLEVFLLQHFLLFCTFHESLHCEVPTYLSDPGENLGFLTADHIIYYTILWHKVPNYYYI